MTQPLVKRDNPRLRRGRDEALQPRRLANLGKRQIEQGDVDIVILELLADLGHGARESQLDLPTLGREKARQGLAPGRLVPQQHSFQRHARARLRSWSGAEISVEWTAPPWRPSPPQ